MVFIIKGGRTKIYQFHIRVLHNSHVLFLGEGREGGEREERREGRKEGRREEKGDISRIGDCYSHNEGDYGIRSETVQITINRYSTQHC